MARAAYVRGRGVLDPLKILMEGRNRALRRCKVVRGVKAHETGGHLYGVRWGKGRSVIMASFELECATKVMGDPSYSAGSVRREARQYTSVWIDVRRLTLTAMYWYTRSSNSQEFKYYQYTCPEESRLWKCLTAYSSRLVGTGNAPFWSVLFVLVISLQSDGPPAVSIGKLKYRNYIGYKDAGIDNNEHGPERGHVHWICRTP
ncbi:hypothetical protein B0H17DRAFT_1128404 [Mycena rosella]|uniref:Uncharacterized protein n=1 Tax=Mycena rosella TaxID=1033263 RepID=A0AAD7GLU6_MYCRO|nr:hypothetical protein B0H17DRAFT_1128404 [Mycena rosella]